jgi:hypothetical protein
MRAENKMHIGHSKEVLRALQYLQREKGPTAVKLINYEDQRFSRGDLICMLLGEKRWEFGKSPTKRTDGVFLLLPFRKQLTDVFIFKLCKLSGEVACCKTLKIGDIK